RVACLCAGRPRIRRSQEPLLSLDGSLCRLAARPGNAWDQCSGKMNTGSRLLRVILLIVIAAAIVWLRIWAFLAPPDLERAAQQAAELQSVIRRQPHFSNV